MALDVDAERLLALLSIAYDRSHTVEQARHILAKVQAAGRALAANEPVRAAISLAHAGLGALPDADASALRLFLAEALLDQGMAPDALTKAAGFPIMKYSPDQPRDDHGRWTSDGAGITFISPATRAVTVGGLYAGVVPVGYNGERNWSSSRAGSGNKFKKIKPHPDKPGHTQ